MPRRTDPLHACDLDGLRAVPAPVETPDFADFWQPRYELARTLPPRVTRREIDVGRDDLRVEEVEFDSLGDFRTGGWITWPSRVEPVALLVEGHGYGGRSEPSLGAGEPPVIRISPCARGFHRSARADVPDNAAEHVVHGIDDPETYVLLGCVADLVWCAANALLDVAPAGLPLIFRGGSFGGGIGALALAWDDRFSLASLGVPTFGHQALKASIRETGSGASSGPYVREHPEVLPNTLVLYDAAVASARLSMPTLFHCAMTDPAVNPTSQFAVANAALARDPRHRLHVKEIGHLERPGTSEAQGHNEGLITQLWEELHVPHLPPAKTA